MWKAHHCVDEYTLGVFTMFNENIFFYIYVKAVICLIWCRGSVQQMEAANHPRLKTNISHYWYYS